MAERADLVLVQLTVLVLLFTLVLERDDDKTHKDVDHEERDDDDVHKVEDGYCGPVVVDGSFVLVGGVYGLVQQPATPTIQDLHREKQLP